MSITYQVLGKPGDDNSVVAWINTGTKFYRLLFDCGENLLMELENSDVNAIDYLLLSHLHLDHIAGFDYFFRRNYDRKNKPVILFGPEGTSEIIHHRLRGFKWNLVEGLTGEWIVIDIEPQKLIANKFLASEGFSNKYFSNEEIFENKILENEDFIIEAAILNHRIPSIAYKITEKGSYNINKLKLEELNLPVGVWLEKLKDFSVSEDETLTVNTKAYKIGELREILLERKEGDSLAYLTDFIFDKKSKANVVKLINGCKTVICECQYKNGDKELAEKNYHLIARQTAELAKKADVEKLILFHISDRYRFDVYPEILREARETFSNSQFPSEWDKYFAPHLFD